MLQVQKDTSDVFSIQQPRQRTFQEWFLQAEDLAVEGVDRITKVPETMRDAADRAEDFLLDSINRVKGSAEERVRDNLTESRLQRIGRQLGSWINNNRVAAGVVAVIVLMLIFRR